jgi:hypothetical protein
MASLFENENTKNNESKEEKASVDFKDREEYKPLESTLGSRLKSHIDRYCFAIYQEPPRWHLGASIIGNSCKRHLWYLFRWCYFPKADGRQKRVFDRGNREEARYIEWLKGIGCQLWATDENGKQYRFSSVMGHFGGSLDSVIKLPPDFNFEQALLASYKTNNTGKGFNELLANGVQKAKPVHWAQECTYGFKMGLEYLAYFNINKNDDDLHVEVLKLDHKLGKQMEDKAEIIIRSQTAPARLSDNPTHYECNYCDLKEICHNKAAIERNCRSCQYASPVEGGEWFCSLPAHNSAIPRDFVKSLKGCDSWISITEVK